MNTCTTCGKPLLGLVFCHCGTPACMENLRDKIVQQILANVQDLTQGPLGVFSEEDTEAACVAERARLLSYMPQAATSWIWDAEHGYKPSAAWELKPEAGCEVIITVRLSGKAYTHEALETGVPKPVWLATEGGEGTARGKRIAAIEAHQAFVQRYQQSAQAEATEHYRRNRAIWVAKIADLEQKVATLTTDLEQAHGRADALNDQHAALVEHVASWQSECMAARGARDEARDNWENTQNAYETLSDLFKGLVRSCDAAEKKLAIANATVDTLRRERDEARQRREEWAQISPAARAGAYRGGHPLPPYPAWRQCGCRPGGVSHTGRRLLPHPRAVAGRCVAARPRLRHLGRRRRLSGMPAAGARVGAGAACHQVAGAYQARALEPSTGAVNQSLLPRATLRKSRKVHD